MYIGPDKVDVVEASGNEGSSVGASEGCAAAPVTLAHFPAAAEADGGSSYAKLATQQFAGYIEVNFMFRTEASDGGLLMYMADAETAFNYVTVLIVGGDVVLNVFPSHQLKAGGDTGTKIHQYQKNISVFTRIVCCR